VVWQNAGAEKFKAFSRSTKGRDVKATKKEGGGGKKKGQRTRKKGSLDESFPGRGKARGGEEQKRLVREESGVGGEIRRLLKGLKRTVMRVDGCQKKE